MPTIISGTTSSTVNVTSTTPTIISQAAVVEVSTGTGVHLNNGSVSIATLAVAGLVAVDVGTAIFTTGNDRINVTQTGQVLAYGSSTDAIILGGQYNQLTVAGYVYATDFGVLAIESSGTDRLTVAATGTVQGGSNAGDGGEFAAAVLMAHGTGVSFVTNHGTIIGDLNSSGASSYRSAVVNATFGSGATREFEELADYRMVLDNTGLIEGDILMMGGNDLVFNSGRIAGTVYLGRDDDNFDGRGGFVTSSVNGEHGNDTIIGGDFFDRLFGDEGNDLLFGLDGGDNLEGGVGNDTLRGGAGDDTLDGDSNSDVIFGGSGDDLIDAGSGTDEVFGDSGDDTIDGGSASDTIDGGSGDDDIDGGTSADVISGRSGDDLIRGDSGGDSMGGGSGNDTLSGGTGHDSLDGGSGHDRMFGGANDDTLEGTLGNDYLDGGSGDDNLSGGSHDDRLDGGTGQDTLSGGTGADIFVFGGVSDSPHGLTRDVITDFEAGVDQIDLSGFSGTLTYIGGAGYSGSAGEVRYNAAVGRLYVDTNGDSASDFSVDLTGNPSLSADDLIL